MLIKKVFNLKLDLNGRSANPRIVVRRNDFDTNVFAAQIFQNGVPVDLTGYTVMFECVTPSRNSVRDTGTIIDAAQGRVEYTLTDQLFSSLGEVDIAYFGFEKQNGDRTERFTTGNFAFEVQADAMTGNVPAGDYLSDIAKMIEQINQLKIEYETLNPANYPTRTEWTENNNQVITQLANIAYYPEQFKTPESDWTSAFAQAINAISSNGFGLLWLAQNKVYEGDIVVNTPNVKISGGGKLKGIIELNTPLIDGVQNSLNFDIDNIKFEYDGVHDYSIKLVSARDGKIQHCYFPNDISKAIRYEELPTYNQIIARVVIKDNEFNGDYSLFCEHDTNYFPLADIKFLDNMCQNKITNIYGIGVDGISFSGNTMFMPGNAKHDANKQQNIHLIRATWVSIDASNHLFEAGLESILLEKCQNPIINGVNIAWPGQRIASCAIRIIKGDLEGLQYTLGSITGCNIMFPTKHGISIEDNTGGITVVGNKVKSAGYSGYYYGSEDLSSMPHYGINTEATTSDILVSGNNTRDNDNNILGGTNFFDGNFDVNRNAIKKNRVLTLDIPDTIISVKGRDAIYLTQPSETTITAFVDGYDGQEITIIALNSNTTISASSAYLLKRRNVKLNSGSVLKLRYASGNWYEIGRSEFLGTLTNVTTADRPTAGMQIGDIYNDTTIDKIIKWNGVTWKDAMGNTV